LIVGSIEKERGGKMKRYKLYGKDKGRKRWQYIVTRSGRSKTSALRTFKIRSGWPLAKAKLVRKRR